MVEGERGSTRATRCPSGATTRLSSDPGVGDGCHGPPVGAVYGKGTRCLCHMLQ